MASSFIETAEQAERYFWDTVAPDLDRDPLVIYASTEQTTRDRAVALMEAAEDVAGIAVRRLAGSGEYFRGGTMSKNNRMVSTIGLFYGRYNVGIPIEKPPIRVSGGNMAIITIQTSEAEDGALRQARAAAEDLLAAS